MAFPVGADTFLIIDGHALIYRAYFAFPGLTAPDGRLVNAVYGFARILLRALQHFSPEYIVVTFDHPKKTFRHEAFEGYKAKRAEMPDDLKPQIALIKEMVAAFNIPQFELAGFEADDLIATLVSQVGEKYPDVAVVIATGDQDAFQLVTDMVHVWLPPRGKFQSEKEYDTAAVVQKLGVRPDQIPEYKALSGDSSDNIPGVKGIGPKTAVSLLELFGTVEKLYAFIDEQGEALSGSGHALLKGATLTKLTTDRASALQSRELATMDRNAPIQLDLAACVVREYDKEKVVKLFEQLNFTSLIGELPADAFELSIQESLF